MTPVTAALTALESAFRRACNYCNGDIAMCERGSFECRAKDARAVLAAAGGVVGDKQFSLHFALPMDSLIHEVTAVLSRDPSTGKLQNKLIEYVDALQTEANAAYDLALDDAARKCEEKWRDGYRGEVTVGFAHVIRSLARKH